MIAPQTKDQLFSAINGGASVLAHLPVLAGIRG